jgi:hypothetical protein
VSRRPAVEVEGARQLRRSLKAAGVSLADLKSAHAEVAAQVATRAHGRAPKVTGRLDASIRSAGTQSAAIVRAGGAAVPYAGPIHWGWPARHITAHPWIADAAEESQDQWSRTYLRAVEQIIDQVEGVPGT